MQDFLKKGIMEIKKENYFDIGEQQMVGQFEIDISDQLIRDYRSIAGLSNEDIIKEIQCNLPKYYKFIAGYGTCIGVFENNLVALEAIVKQLSIKDKQSLPILVCQKMLGGDSPLDFSIKAHQQKIINLILSMIIKYQDHIVFNQLVDKNFNELIIQQIDLQEYFESNLPIYQILDSKFPCQHHDDQELIVGISLTNPKEVHEKYDELFGSKLLQKNGNNNSQVSIEYHLINLPITLQYNPLELMRVLSATEKFYIYLIFLAFFIFDTFYSTYSSKVSKEDYNQNQGLKESEAQQPNIWIKISTKAICTFVLIYFLIYEVQQVIIQRGNYFDDGWNYFDFSHIASFTVYCILDFTAENQDNLILIKILVIILSFMKLFFFLRIYDGFSFLVQMMGGVFKDIKYFLSFFLIMILQFGMIFLVLFKADSIEEYNGVNYFAYFLMAFRISSGDFNVDNYQKQGEILVIFSWIIWLIAVMTLNIVFMNFIIAVISESYERVMQKLVAESFKVKAHMIVEREQLFTQNELTQQEHFPNFIVVRRPINNDANEAGEWQGFIKDLKQTIRTSAAKTKGEIIQNLHSIETQNNQNSVQLEKIQTNEEQLAKIQLEQLDSRKEFQQFKETITSQVKGLNDDMSFIKSSLISILEKQSQ
ncbi:wd-40 repeat protein [Stylonychia lemnae]|uniref:Wd-40 repeat protein n=1 Tax=Stylonychia lemnae TaxID=5949 RepID=A0A077ZXS4_STYLE|nr:wd-40 repeat protein [Stylonychia lemnae]|eukprot:CDW74716.1 wd-40 repeat protein [Stylonychia lemnae]